MRINAIFAVGKIRIQFALFQVTLVIPMLENYRHCCWLCMICCCLCSGKLKGGIF